MSSKVEDAVTELVNIFVEKAHKVNGVGVYGSKPNEQGTGKEQDSAVLKSEGRFIHVFRFRASLETFICIFPIIKA